MSKHEDCRCHEAVKLGFKVAKLVLKAATVCATFRIAHELHKVHKAIEKKK